MLTSTVRTSLNALPVLAAELSFLSRVAIISPYEEMCVLRLLLLYTQNVRPPYEAHSFKDRK